MTTPNPPAHPAHCPKWSLDTTTGEIFQEGSLSAKVIISIKHPGAAQRLVDDANRAHAHTLHAINALRAALQHALAHIKRHDQTQALHTAYNRTRVLSDGQAALALTQNPPPKI
jgi:hypothetical protein